MKFFQLHREGSRSYAYAWIWLAMVMVAGAAEIAPGSFSENPLAEEFLHVRIFEEPLVPMGGQTVSAENRLLAQSLIRYSSRTSVDDFSSITEFISSYPNSTWIAALLTNLGIEFYKAGYYSRAMTAWERAWALGKGAVDLPAKAIADRALGELIYLYAKLGRADQIEALLKSIEGRNLTGPATSRVAGAKQGLWNMRHRPEVAFRCGPLALERIRVAEDKRNVAHPLIVRSVSTADGLSLDKVMQLSKELGMNYQMVKREPGAELIVPAVVHWKVGHYAGIVRAEKGRYLVQDPTFRNDVWMTAKALEEEASGYFLIPPGELLEGWRAVGTNEGQTIWGKGNTDSSDPNATTEDDEKCKPCEGAAGMPVYNIHTLLVSLNIKDTPVGYEPAVGMPIQFTATYNQYEANQPSLFRYSNLGPKWSFNWLAYIRDNSFMTEEDVEYYMEGGGTSLFVFDFPTQTFRHQFRNRSVLARTSATSYEMRFPDGSKKIFGKPDVVAGTSRKVFLTQVIDPAGNAVQLTYDSNLRLSTITDAVGRITTLSYERAGDIYKITKVTDPFARTAVFAYDGTGHLISIVDRIGLTSQFSYGVNDFITTMTTPYGMTRFTAGAETMGSRDRWLEVTDPEGRKERAQYSESLERGVEHTEPTSLIPQGIFYNNEFLAARNTYYWDKKAMAEGFSPQDFTKAKIYHFTHGKNFDSAGFIVESVKSPYENRIWFNYPDQSEDTAWFPGSADKPTKIGRVLDDGSTQLYQFEYNSIGNTTQAIDPVGRTFSFVYAPNGVDLTEIRQTRGGKNELVERYTYNAQHRPLTRTDAAGQTTVNTYNSRGQVVTVKNPKGEVTTFSYDTDGSLLSIDGPLAGTSDRVTFTYDSARRIRTTTDVDGYTITLDYDAMDRITKATYPDGTFDLNTYDRLDVAIQRDRLGRETHYAHDRLRQLVSVRDPLNRISRLDWCGCGSLDRVIDPSGRPTTLNRDVQGRVTSIAYADGSEIFYTYEKSTSRIKSVQDQKGQVTEFDYYPDDRIKLRRYANSLVPTPSVSFTYDPDYPRIAAMQDGTGATTFSYGPVLASPSLQALRLVSVDGPLPDDTISFQYDPLGRVINRAIGASGSAATYDPLDRLTGSVNALGAFSYSYDGASDRISARVYPNGQRLTLSYFPNAGDRRLQQMLHVKPAGAPLSTFQYAYDAVSRITNWTQQVEASTSQSWHPVYDAADRLNSAVLMTQAGSVKTFKYSYDASDNRALEQIDATSRQFQYNTLNQVITSGTGQVAAATYEWDGANQLVSVVKGNQRSEFKYDGLGRRVRIVEKLNGATTLDRRFVWCESELCEERDAAGATVLKRFFEQGMQVLISSGGLPVGTYFYSRDHLGSVREMVDSAGAVRARYDYDPYGRRTKLAGDLEADFGFTGYYYHGPTQLHLALYRQYDAELGRWLSRDPIGEKGGLNLYAYVANNPLNKTDPFGLQEASSFSLKDAKTGYKMAKDALKKGKSPGLKEYEKLVKDECKNKEATEGFFDKLKNLWNTASDSLGGK